MKILYIHQYFKVPSEPGGTRSYWIAKELIKNGHQVTMITANPKAIVAKEVKSIDGIKVIYLKEDYAQGMNIAKRMKAFLGFVFKSTREAFRENGVDLVIATSTPLTIGIPALLLKWFRGRKYVFEVRDLWPEVPIQMGAINNPLLIRAARYFEKTIYKNAEHVIALSPGMRDGVVKYIPKERTSMIPNMSKVTEFFPRKRNLQLMRQLGLKEETFKLIHFGALGVANGIETILDAAKLIKNDSSIQFVFLGGGSTEKELMSICKKEGLDNVVFLPRTPMKETSEIVNFCDVSLVSFKDLPILYTNSPNKLFDSLSAGKPIIVNSAGWTKDMVEQCDCGYYVNPAIPSQLVDKIIHLKNDDEVLERMGANSRKLAETIFDRTILCKQFAETVNSVISR